MYDENKAMIERIVEDGIELAIIIRNEYCEQGIHFLTDKNYSQQLAYMHHPTGKVIDAHIHNFEERKIIYTQEVLIIKSGVLRVDFYKRDKTYLESRELFAGDIILLASGGHGFEVIQDAEIIEIKQGPYLEEKDKTRFPGVNSDSVFIRM